MNDELFLVGFEVLTAMVMKDITPYSPLKVNRRFGGTYPLHLQGRISRAGGKLATAMYHDTSVDFQRTTRRYIPEDRTHHVHYCLS
jgi:hypothetical protein